MHFCLYFNLSLCFLEQDKNGRIKIEKSNVILSQFLSKFFLFSNQLKAIRIEKDLTFVSHSIRIAVQSIWVSVSSTFVAFV